MEIFTKPDVLSLFTDPTEAFFFDRAGRLFAAWREGWYIHHGLSGRAMARRWVNQRRELRPLPPEELRGVRDRAHTLLEDAQVEIRRRMGTAAEGDPRLAWVARAAASNPDEVTRGYHACYRPIGILPPDQYHSCVVQLTEGCSWNRCGFCVFYRSQRFRVKGPEELRRHLRAVRAYHGEGLSLRRSIFLGQANALSAPIDALVDALHDITKILVPEIPLFRGFFSFIEPTESSAQAPKEFRRLVNRGLQRIYYGIETGCEELRQKLGKPGRMEQVAASIRAAKAGGMQVGLIFLVGAGGKTWAERHVRESTQLVHGLPLDPEDVIYLSPLHGSDGVGEQRLAPISLEIQYDTLKARLGGPARVARYDIREFVY